MERQSRESLNPCLPESGAAHTKGWCMPPTCRILHGHWGSCADRAATGSRLQPQLRTKHGGPCCAEQMTCRWLDASPSRKRLRFTRGLAEIASPLQGSHRGLPRTHRGALRKCRHWDCCHSREHDSSRWQADQHQGESREPRFLQVLLLRPNPRSPAWRGGRTLDEGKKTGHDPLTLHKSESHG